jgi:hypothetical protein
MNFSFSESDYAIETVMGTAIAMETESETVTGTEIVRETVSEYGHGDVRGPGLKLSTNRRQTHLAGGRTCCCA